MGGNVRHTAPPLTSLTGAYHFKPKLTKHLAQQGTQHYFGLGKASTPPRSGSFPSQPLESTFSTQRLFFKTEYWLLASLSQKEAAGSYVDSNTWNVQLLWKNPLLRLYASCAGTSQHLRTTKHAIQQWDLNFCLHGVFSCG